MNNVNELKKMQSMFETQIKISNDNEVTLNEITKSNLTDLLKQYISKDLVCTELCGDYFKVGFCTGVWGNGEPRYTEISMSYSKIFYISQTEKQLMINPCCFGAFQMVPYSDQKKYYILVGKLLESEIFQTKAIELLSNFSHEETRLHLDRHKLRTKLHACNKQIALYEKSLIKIENYETTISLLNDFNDGYVVVRSIDMDDISAFTYRNKMVDVLIDSFSHNIDIARIYANEHNIKYGKFKNEYKVIQVSKIKYNKENLLNF